MTNLYVTVRVASGDAAAAMAALEAAGHVARVDSSWPAPHGEVHVEARSLVLEANETAWQQVNEAVDAALTGAGVAFEVAARMTGVGTVTRFHRELPVTLDGEVTWHYVRVVDDHDIDQRLTALAAKLRIDRSRLDVVRPVPWPAI